MKLSTKILWIPFLFLLISVSPGVLDREIATADATHFVDRLDATQMTATTAISRSQATPLAAAQTLSQTFYAQTDTYIDQATPSTNYGTDPYVYVGINSTTSDRQNTLLGFDIASLPDDIIVTSATLEAWAEINLAAGTAPESEPESVASPTAGDIKPEAVLAAWSEGTVTWNTRPPTSGQGDPASAYQFGWTTWDVTNIVQGWVNGTLVNHGIQLSQQTGSGSHFFFAEDHANEPRLTIMYEPAPCTAVTGVSIGGPGSGLTGTNYDFSATVSPVDATTPFTYTWEATDHAGSQDTAIATFSWDTPGTKTVTLTVENCGGSVTTTHTVTINTPPPACEAPLTGLSLKGSLIAAIGELQTFEAAAIPTTATTPLTYTWEATEQTAVVQTGDLATTTLDWSWDTAGTKRITVTAENCGGTFTALHDLDVVESADLPDLTITGTWYDGDVPRVGYIVRNQGNVTAPAGHTTRLSRDGNLLNEVVFDQPLIPGALRAGYVGSAWICGASTAQLQLETDISDLVSESDEANNAFVDTWACDLEPPEIISGPTVLTTTEHTAAIAWETDEPTSSRVDYGRSTYTSDGVEHLTGPTTTHQVTLTGLEDGSTYRYQLFVSDAGGNTTNSPELYFETQPLGSDPPNLTGVTVTPHSSPDYEFYTIAAALANPGGIERVAFYLNGTLLGTDYTGSTGEYAFSLTFSPHALGLTRDDFFGQSHQIEARAFTLLGLSDSLNDTYTPDPKAKPMTLAVMTPNEGGEVLVDGTIAPPGTEMEVTIVAIQYEWDCTWSSGTTPPGVDPVRCQDVAKSGPSAVNVWIDGMISGGDNAPPDLWVHTFPVNISGLAVGDHVLRVWIRASDGEVVQKFVNFEVAQGTPSLVLDRTVTRDGNVFDVELTLENQGTATAPIDYLIDAVEGFQVIHTSTQPGRQSAATEDAPSYHEVTTAWFENAGDSRPLVRIDLDGSNGVLNLGPGESYKMGYQLLPILYETLALSRYEIGATARQPNGTYLVTRDGGIPEGRYLFASGSTVLDLKSGTLVPLDQAVTDAAATADYLLVTSPYQLWQHALDSSGTAGLGELVSQMARLASLKDGVLAYVEDTIPSGVLDDLLESGGLWADALHPNFRQTSKGYVLFVGEEEILPVQGAGYGVDYSDLRYASTGGAARPELVLGRLVGDNINTLRQPLDAAITYHINGSVFDRSSAVLVSGRGKGEGTYWSDVNDMADRLGSTDVKKIRWKSHGDPTAPEDEEWRSYFNILNDFIQQRDIIVFRGHGGDDIWSPGVYSWDVGELNLSATTRPFVMALSCHTGDFKGGDDTNIAEAFLQNGAAVYIGSMETSSRIRNSDAARGFFNRWEPSRSVGDVFHDLQRDKWDDFDWGIQEISWERWVYDYMYFGDPKYGAPLTSVASTAPALDPSIVARSRRTVDGTRSATELVISVPDFEVTPTEEGHDYVAFPNADRIAKEGDYMVPVWTVSVEYPQGERVQDVRLLNRGGLEVTTGLQLPTATFQIDALNSPEPALATADDGWHPAINVDLRWATSERRDGTTELRISLYPVHYNPTTTDLRFYRDFTLEVETINTTVTLDGLTTGALTYAPGDPIALDLTVSNAGTAQDVIARATVKTLAGREVAGLPLKTLHDLQGTAHLSLVWDSTGIPVGDYVLEVTLLDTQGQTLDHDREEVKLGELDEMVALTTPSGTFNPGEAVALSMVVTNTGSIPISGTAYIRIQDTHTFSTAAVYTRALSSLLPDSAVTVDETWMAAEPGGMGYRASAYVRYGGSVSEVVAVDLKVNGRIYLPMVSRQLP